MTNTKFSKMIKDEIDKYFIQVYGSIEEYSIKALKHFKSKIELENLLSETYLYIIKNADKIEDKNVLESFCKQFIKNSIRWTNSELNRSMNYKLELVALETIEYKTVDSHDFDFSRYKMLCFEFFKSLTNYEKRLFNIWFNLEKKSGKDISSYLKISLSLSYKTIKECKVIEERFKSFILSKYNL